MKNYICINGNKTELTPEQLKQLGIELPKASPFERVVNTANTFYNYYFIGTTGIVDETYDGGYCEGNGTDDLRYRNANYCTDKSLMEQRALHETLNRLLWRYSMEHDGDKIQWSSNIGENKQKAFIYYNHHARQFEVYTRWDNQFLGCVWFNTNEIAENAIEEIVKPFLASHPDFKF